MINSNPPDPCNFLLPLVLLWDPYTQFFPEKTFLCPHDQCGRQATTKYWNDGTLPYRQPRTIHGVEDTILLVSAVYICDRNHKTLAHDPRVINTLSRSIVPFVLIHRTGFHRLFLNMISSFCHNGMNFHSLEASIGEMRWENFLVRKSLYENAVEQFRHSSQDEVICKDFPSFEETAMNYLPSNDVMCSCFLAKFTEDENYYIRSIQSEDTGDSLSIDHTFKIASNIGYLRRDGKWVSQYDSVFFIINHDGKILSWKFTKGTSFQQVEDVLTGIGRRAYMQGNAIKTIYIDNCCQWRNKLQRLLGNELQVKLDVFHAIQRITKKISKRHPFYSHCVNDLTLVFREESDHGEVRTKATPEPSVLLKHIITFTNKWDYSSMNEQQRVLSKDAIAEIDKLKVHIMKGCLSEIPVGCGTNRNEAFHRHTNTFFHKSRIGILYAYAILMLIIYKFNSTQKKNLGKPIRAVSVPTQRELEIMGILPEDRLHPAADTTDIRFDHIDSETMQHILNTSISQYILSQAIKNQTRTASNIFNYVPFMEPLHRSGLLSMKCLQSEGHKERLLTILKSWNFVLEPVPADGNCFFTAVALNMLHENSNVLEDILGVKEQSMVVLIEKLRQSLVKEFLGPNRNEYENAYLRQNYEEEAAKFLEDGFYDSQLGDAMPLAMANALKCNIVIFQSNESMPITYVSPRERSNNVIFVAYTNCGPGHYDSTIYKDACCDLKFTAYFDVKCRCGVNVKDQKQAACTGEGHARCKCLAAKKQCTSQCGCKGCGNPYGIKVRLGKRKRERHPHLWQTLDFSNKSALLNRGEILEDGCWSVFESIVFTHVVLFITCSGTLVSADKIEVVYNPIATYSIHKDCLITLPEKAMLRNKTKKQISAKLNHFNKECRIFTEFA